MVFLHKLTGYYRLLITVFLLLFFIQVHADNSVSRTISITASASEEVVPDMTVWQLTVTETGPETGNLATKHASQVNQVIRFLKVSGINDRDMSTTGTQLRENWVYRNNSREQEGFIANTQIRFELKDSDLYLSLWKGLADIKGTSVENIQYALSDPDNILNKLRIAALNNGREQAAQLAEAAGMTLGFPVSIQVDSAPVRQPGMVMAMAESRVSEDNQPTMAGVIKLEAHVNLTYELLFR